MKTWLSVNWKSWKNVSICELESSRYDINNRGKSDDQENKVYGIYTCDLRCMIVKLLQVFQRNYNAVLWRQTRRPTQMLARARHTSPLWHWNFSPNIKISPFISLSDCFCLSWNDLTQPRDTFWWPIDLLSTDQSEDLLYMLRCTGEVCCIDYN